MMCMRAWSRFVALSTGSTTLQSEVKHPQHIFYPTSLRFCLSSVLEFNCI